LAGSGYYQGTRIEKSAQVIIEINGAGAMSLKNLKSFINNRGWPIFARPFVLTARQYGEVVLPDEVPGSVHKL